MKVFILSLSLYLSLSLSPLCTAISCSQTLLFQGFTVLQRKVCVRVWPVIRYLANEMRFVTRTLHLKNQRQQCCPIVLFKLAKEYFINVIYVIYNGLSLFSENVTKKMQDQKSERT